MSSFRNEFAVCYVSAISMLPQYFTCTHTYIKITSYVVCQYFESYLLQFSCFFMEYSIVEGKILNSKNYECQGYRYVKVRESPNSIFLKCALFRTHRCESLGKIDKITKSV